MSTKRSPRLGAFYWYILIADCTQEVRLFKNFYECDDCGHQWEDVWSCQCDDDCPECGARHMSPYKSEDAEDA